MNATAAAAVSVLARPFARIPEVQRRRICLILLTAAALAFPLLHDNDADVDSMANAAAYATLALGLNIVVGFAGLLDLGYAAFFAIGAYTYGILTAFQLQPEWSAFWEPFHYPRPRRQDAGRHRPRQRGALHPVVLARPAARRGARRLLRHPVRRTHAAAARRLPRHRHARLRRDRADRGAQLVGSDQRRRRPQRRRRAAPVRLELRRRRAAVLLRRDRHGGAAGLHQRPIARLANRPRLDGDPRGRDRRRRDGRRPHQVQAAGLRHRRRVRRHDRRVLCRQAADRDAGDVRLPGLGDDPGDDRVRRHRQRLGRGAGRVHPAASAVVVAAGPDRMAACTRTVRRQRLAAARRPGAVDRADLRPHPGRHDAVPPAGADPGDTGSRRR